MCYKLFRVIDNNGLAIEPQNFDLNEEVLISDVKKNENLKIRNKLGKTFTFDKVLNSFFDGIFLIKTEHRTWIFEQV